MSPGHWRRDPHLRVGWLVAAGFTVAALFLAASAWITRGVLSGQLDQADRRILAWIQEHRTDWLTELMLELTALGGVGVLGIVCASAVAYALAVRRQHLASLFIAVFLGAALLNTSFKLLVGRPRPREFFVDRAAVHSPSFPSGHSLMAAVVYLTFGVLLWRLAPTRTARTVIVTVAAGLALLVGFSRIYLGVHYPSDVAGGWLAGAAWALTCLSLYSTLRRRRGGARATEPGGGPRQP